MFGYLIRDIYIDLLDLNNSLHIRINICIFKDFDIIKIPNYYYNLI